MERFFHFPDEQICAVLAALNSKTTLFCSVTNMLDRKDTERQSSISAVDYIVELKTVWQRVVQSI